MKIDTLEVGVRVKGMRKIKKVEKAVDRMTARVEKATAAMDRMVATLERASRAYKQLKVSIETSEEWENG